MKITAVLFENRYIPLDSIIFSSNWNLHPWELYTISDDLVSSFSRTGILHPPVLLQKEDNRFEIVCGFKRLFFASSSCKPQKIQCLVLPKKIEPVAILDIILTDQCLFHTLSLVEKAQFLKMCGRYLRQEEIVNTFCDRLALDKRPSTLSTLSEVLQQPPLVISEIHYGALQEKVALELLRLPSKTDRIALVKLFKDLCMGDGKQRKILPLVRDLAFRHDMSIAAFLGNSSIQEILGHKGMNNPQKIQHLVSFLQQQTNPLSTNAEVEFAKNVNSLKVPENWAITHSPSFEKDEVTLSITFNNFAKCKELIPTLKKNIGSL